MDRQVTVSAFTGTLLILTSWLYNDEKVRGQYRNSVSIASNQIRKDFAIGKITAQKTARQGVGMRNTYIQLMRDRSSPVGLLIARWVFDTGSSVMTVFDQDLGL